MQIQTHLMSGWCLASHAALTPRERALSMVAATASDLDGLGILISIDHYARYHHILGHNLLFGIVLSTILAAFSTHRVRAFAIYLALFHVHLVLDYFGSGPGWGVQYLWPFSPVSYESALAWPLLSWQNTATAVLFLLWLSLIVIYQHRTPLEAILPALDKKIVARYGRPTPGRRQPHAAPPSSSVPPQSPL